MLRSTKDLEGYGIAATDGDIGHVKDFYFDDHTWVVRYLEVETGAWLASRKVLISPISVGEPNWSAKTLPVTLTREQVKSSPDIDTNKPVSRQHEMDYAGYYGYPYYWGGDGMWGGGGYPNMMLPGYEGAGTPASDPKQEGAVPASQRANRENEGDPHLRSTSEVDDYHLHATDGDVGHVEGMLIDDKSWAVRYLIVNTSNWWVGHKVLIAPQWITGVSWSDSKVSVNVTREAVKNSPVYHPEVEVSREHEKTLYRFHDRPGYWGTE